MFIHGRRSKNPKGSTVALVGVTLSLFFPKLFFRVYVSGCVVLTRKRFDTFSDVLLINKVHCLVLTEKARVCYFSLVVQIKGRAIVILGQRTTWIFVWTGFIEYIWKLTTVLTKCFHTLVLIVLLKIRKIIIHSNCSGSPSTETGQIKYTERLSSFFARIRNSFFNLVSFTNSKWRRRMTNKA